MGLDLGRRLSLGICHDSLRPMGTDQSLGLGLGARSNRRPPVLRPGAGRIRWRKQLGLLIFFVRRQPDRLVSPRLQRNICASVSGKPGLPAKHKLLCPEPQLCGHKQNPASICQLEDPGGRDGSIAAGLFAVRASADLHTSGFRAPDSVGDNPRPCRSSRPKEGKRSRLLVRSSRFAQRRTSLRHSEPADCSAQ
jgi:hypothetical protein